MKIRKNDNVIVISGKDRGKTGKVIRALPRENKVIVAGVNLLKVHKRARREKTKGEVVEKTMPVHVSNVMLIDSKTNKGTRVGYSNFDGQKTRVSKRSGDSI